MSSFEAQVPIVEAEAEGLADFLDALSAEDWSRSSACELWTVRDVVAHLVWAADFYTDTVTRGVQGDSSTPGDRPPGDAPDSASMPAYFHQHTLQLRDRLGAELLPRFRSSFRGLSKLLSRLSAKQWEMPCSFFRHRGGALPAHAFLALSIQEATIHSWDIRSRFDASAALSSASLSPLQARLPNRFRGGFATFPMGAQQALHLRYRFDPKQWVRHGGGVYAQQALHLRYRFDLSGDDGRNQDLIVEDGVARLALATDEPADVTLGCDQSTFVLMMYKRLALDAASSAGGLRVESDHPCLSLLDQWLQQP